MDNMNKDMNKVKMVVGLFLGLLGLFLACFRFEAREWEGLINLFFAALFLTYAADAFIQERKAR